MSDLVGNLKDSITCNKAPMISSILMIFQHYEENNEVSLDSWTPGGTRTSCYGDKNSLRSSSPNSFMQTTLDDLNNLSGSQQLDQDDLDFCSVANSNRSVANSNRSSVASSSRSSVAMSGSGSETSGRTQSGGGGSESDYSSEPWMNPKYMTEDKHSCATWPIRK